MRSPRQLVAAALRLGPPLSGWNDSNTNYILAGMLIRTVTGHSPATEIRRRILVPLGLRDTSFALRSTRIPGPHAHGYIGRLDVTNLVNPSGSWTSGAMISTVDDVATFYRALLTGRLLPPTERRELLSAIPVHDIGEPFPERYGLGIHRTPSGRGDLIAARPASSSGRTPGLLSRPMCAEAVPRSFDAMFKHSTADEAPMIVVDRLTKRYGHATVVDRLSFQVRPGRVTGFLGPNGAGKTQTIKMILGLVRASAGTATVDGRPLIAHEHPARAVGSVLDGGAFSPGRPARSALRITARVAGVPFSRVDELIELVGLGDEAGRKVGDYSLGMRQRLALAQGLLTDPVVLIADEPANGLDPAGISWLRGLLRELAGRGMTVLLSSHLLSEAERLVDDVIVIARGRLVTHGSLDDLRAAGRREVVVEAADQVALAAELRARGMTVAANGGGPIRVCGEVATVGQIAAQARIPLLKLEQTEEGLEELFLRLTDRRPEDAR